MVATIIQEEFMFAQAARNISHRATRCRQPSDYGIAIGPILFVIAILAILATAIAAGTGSFSSDTQRESDEVAANTLLGYVIAVQQATQRVLSLGTDWQNISFGSPILHLRLDGTSSGRLIDNPNCAASTCKVFDQGGGGVLWKQFTNYSVDTATMLANGQASSSPVGGHSWFYMMTVAGMGTGANNLVLKMMYIRPNICSALAARIGNPSNVTITGSLLPFAHTSIGVCASGCDTTAQSMTTTGLKNRMIFTDIGGGWYCNLYAVLHVR